MKDTLQKSQLLIKIAALSLGFVFSLIPFGSFFPLYLYSQELSILENNFWKNIRETKLISQIQRYDRYTANMSENYKILHLFLKQKMYHDHFFNKFSKHAVHPTSHRIDEIEIIRINTEFFDALQNESAEKIKAFMEKYGFTKSDKVIIMLVIIFNGWQSDHIFNLIDSLGLSVNDTLNYQDINSPFIKNEFNNSDRVITVLSHHLAGTGDPVMLTRLLNTPGYDPHKTNYLQENIIHSFIRLRNMNFNAVNASQNTLQYKKALSLLAEHSPELTNDQDILGFIPLASALDIGDKTAVEVLMDRQLPTNFTATNILGKGLRELAHEAIPFYLQDKLPEKPAIYIQSHKKQGDFELVSLDFEPFMNHLISTIRLTNPLFFSRNGKKFYHLKKEVQNFEELRLRVLSYIINSNDMGFSKDIPILKAIINRSEHFFRNFPKEKKNRLENGFFNTNQQQRFFVTNFLLEAIRHSLLPAVEYILDNRIEIAPFYRSHRPFNPDLLSLAILTYASLEKGHPHKKEARQIIEIVAHHITLGHIEPAHNSPLNFSPVTWAILLGLLDEVRFLHEDKGFTLPEAIIAKDQPETLELTDYNTDMESEETIVNFATATTGFVALYNIDMESEEMMIVSNQSLWKMDLIDYTKHMGFAYLSNYLNGKRKGSKCKNVILH